MASNVRIKSEFDRLNQRGLASIIVVTVLVVLLTLISIGFARLMGRSVTNSTNNQLSTAANYGAQSGINDVIAYLQKNLNPATGSPNRDIEATQCNQLLDTTPTHTDPTKINAFFSGNGNTNEKYTCILVNSQPPEIFYQKIPAQGSQVIKMTTNPSNISSLLLSWQSADNPPQNNFPASGTSLLNETAWSAAKNAPLMRVSLYPIAGDNTNYDANGLATASRTYFLYPTSSSTATPPSNSTTIGETKVLTTNDNGNANLLVSQSATLSQTSTIQSLSFYVTTAAGNLRMGIYDATGPGGGPGTKKAETAEITPVAGWNTASVTTPVSLPAGTYWLAYLPSNNGLGFIRDNDSSSSARYYSYTYGGLPTTFSSTPTSDPTHWSFYATLNTASTACATDNKAVTCPTPPADGSLIPVYCDTSVAKPITNFSSGASNDLNCNLVISNLQSLITTGSSVPQYFYVRLTPIYDQASVQIKANNTSNNAVKFVNVQAVADVTAKVNTASKRLRARINLNGLGKDNIPEDSLRSAEAICKRISVYTITPEQTNIGGIFCPNYINTLSPSVSLSANNTSITVGDSVNLTWTGSYVTDCPTSSPSSWAASNTNSNGTVAVTPPLGDTTYTITCTGNNGSPVTSNQVTIHAAASSGNCADGIQNGDETGIDTGGRCGSPGTGDCFDGIQNGDETGVDTGGRCGTGGGGGPSAGVDLQYDPGLPNNDAFRISFSNVSYCALSANDGRSWPIFAPPSAADQGYDYGSGFSTAAHIDCYDGGLNWLVGADATRGANPGCDFRPVFDGWDNIDCVSTINGHVHQDQFGQFIQCFNTTGTPEGLNCNTYTGGGGGGNPPVDVPGCTNSQASNYNPLANIDDGSCILGGGCGICACGDFCGYFMPNPGSRTTALNRNGIRWQTIS